MDGRLADKTAIVTGSSSGIGKAIAKRFAAEGANVVTNSRSASRAQLTADEITADGGTAVAVEADVSKESDIDRLLTDATDAFGTVDVLVNNAGTESIVPAMEVTREEWQSELDVNLTGTFFCAQAVARHMIEEGDGGQIINVSSILGTRPLQGRTAYCVSKAGINSLTRTLAIELADEGVSVNAIAPGYIGGTELVSDENIRVPEEYEAEDGEEWPVYVLDDPEAIDDRIPAGRKGAPEEIAASATFLAEGDHYVNGEILHADGGVQAFGWGSKR